jgi:hypothetical protein
MEASEIIKAVLAQHKMIVSQIDKASDTVGDLAAVLRLERARGDMTTAFQQTLDQKLSRLEEVLAPVDRGLRNHYQFEEDVLPPLLGRVLAYSGPIRPLIPFQIGHPFRFIPATCSG